MIVLENLIGGQGSGCGQWAANQGTSYKRLHSLLVKTHTIPKKLIFTYSYVKIIRTNKISHNIKCTIWIQSSSGDIKTVQEKSDPIKMWKII